MLASFQGLGDAPGGAGFASTAWAVSDNGVVVGGGIGSTTLSDAFRWTEAGGMESLGAGGSARDVSADGSVVVGRIAGTPGAFRWTAGTGAIYLGDLPGGATESTAYAVSDDGTVVAGVSSSTAFPNTGAGEGFRWVNPGPIEGLGALPGSISGSLMQGISGDGTVVVGRSDIDSGSSRAVKWTEGVGFQVLDPGRANAASYDGSVIVGYAGDAIRWTDQGMEVLGRLPGTLDGWALDITADGSIIVGVCADGDGTGTPFIYDDASTPKMRDLRAVLASDYGLGSALSGWDLAGSASIFAVSISPNGQFIAGSGINPLGRTEAWMVNLGDTSGALSVDAGQPQTILVNQVANLNGTVTGGTAPTFQWSVVTGPGTVTIADDTAEDTTAAFSLAGLYVLKLNVTDGPLTAADQLYVVVNPLTADLTAAADTYISNASKDASKNFGTVTSLVMDGNPDKAALLRWDLTGAGGIPVGSTVHSATLSLNVTNGSSNGGYEIYELKRDWVEGTGGTSAANWTKATATTNWQTAGAQGTSGATPDRGTTVLGTVGGTTTGVRTFSLDLATVQNWVNNPAANKGLILQDYANTTNDDLQFSSREFSTLANRPRLIVEYSPPLSMGPLAAGLAEAAALGGTLASGQQPLHAAAVDFLLGGNSADNLTRRFRSTAMGRLG